MCRIKDELEAMGHLIEMPPVVVDDGKGGKISVVDRYNASKEAKAEDSWVWDMREMAMRNHFAKVERSDAVVVVNEEKRGIPGYVGANTLLEMGLAFHLRKPIYLVNEIPEISYKEEILGMKPVVINGDLSLIRE